MASAEEHLTMDRINLSKQSTKMSRHWKIAKNCVIPINHALPSICKASLPSALRSRGTPSQITTARQFLNASSRTITKLESGFRRKEDATLEKTTQAKVRWTTRSNRWKFAELNVHLIQTAKPSHLLSTRTHTAKSTKEEPLTLEISMVIQVTNATLRNDEIAIL
jgi:hypothetical protein